MANFSMLPLLFILISLFCLHFPVAQSDGDKERLIQQVTGKNIEEATDGGAMCSRISTPGTCPVNCFRADPVCGVDGVTYWCGCPDAACHGARVAKLGPCEVGNSGSASLPGQALLLIHIVWLFLLGFSLLFGLF